MCVHNALCVRAGQCTSSLYLPSILICSQVGRVDMIGGGVETGVVGKETGAGGVETGVGGAEAGVDEAEVPDEVANGRDKVPGTSTAMVTTTSTTAELLTLYCRCADTVVLTTPITSMVSFSWHIHSPLCTESCTVKRELRSVCVDRVHGVCAVRSMPSVRVQGVSIVIHAIGELRFS